MLILDFSHSPNLKNISLIEEWQQNIYSFLKDWYSDSNTITTQTSGSTGTPKKIEIPKKAMIHSATMTGEFLNLKNKDTALLCMPSQYIGGKMMIVRAIVWKLKLFCIEPSSSPLENLNQIFDLSAMTPMQVEKSINKLQNIKKLIIGGNQISFNLLQKLKGFNTSIYESFGMTETISHIALKKVSGANSEDIFKLLPKTKIRIDERGCLCITSPFFDYELITNDLVSIISHSEFQWLGRIDNVINSGGIKISPEKVEKQLKSIISEDFIISSKPDNILGEKVVLLIEGQKNIELEKNIQQFPYENKYEIPREILYNTKLKRTATGKIIRKINL